MTPPTTNPSTIAYFGETNYRGRQTRFGFRQSDRMGHIHIIGKTGTGKSTLLETLMRQDIESGQGMALLDPHGDLVEKIESVIPAHRKADLIYFNVPDPSNTLGFNPLEQIAPLKRPLAASGLLEVFKKLWIDSWDHGWNISYAMLYLPYSINRSQRLPTYCGYLMTTASENKLRKTAKTLGFAIFGSRNMKATRPVSGLR